MNIKKYLHRIKYTGSTRQNLPTLEALMYHHLFAIPFENLDIYNGITVYLDPESVYHKVVTKNRGGYCYELNSLFYKLLSELGFDVSIISGRLPQGKEVGPLFDHMALVVTIAKTEYLVDVGFGDFSIRPLPVTDTSVQHDGYSEYKIIGNTIIDDTSFINIAKWNTFRGVFETEYLYSTTPVKLEDFLPMHVYQQTSKQSHFTQNLICTLPTPTGRISIVNNRLVVTAGGEKSTKLISNTQQKEELLKSHFNIDYQIPVLAV